MHITFVARNHVRNFRHQSRAHWTFAVRREEIQIPTETGTPGKRNFQNGEPLGLVIHELLTDAAADALAANIKASTTYSRIGKLKMNKAYQYVSSTSIYVCQTSWSSSLHVNISISTGCREDHHSLSFISPKPKMPEPMIGMLQWSFACTDQPYQLPTRDARTRSAEWAKSI